MIKNNSYNLIIVIISYNLDKLYENKYITCHTLHKCDQISNKYLKSLKIFTINSTRMLCIFMPITEIAPVVLLLVVLLHQKFLISCTNGRYISMSVKLHLFDVLCVTSMFN